MRLKRKNQKEKSERARRSYVMLRHVSAFSASDVLFVCLLTDSN